MSYSVIAIRDRYMDLVAKDETQFFRLLNEAEARLLETAMWNWTKVRAELTVVDGHVYLDPAVYASLLGIVLDDGARIIRPQETEFTPGTSDVATAGEVGYGHLIDCGIVLVDLGGPAPVPRKKYKIAGSVSDTTVDCLLHLSHTPLTLFTEYLLCPSARAIKLAMQAVVYEEADDVERAEAFWSKAYSALSEQEKTQRGNSRGSITMQFFGEGIAPIGNIN
jgi:hypothetical protein